MKLLTSAISLLFFSVLGFSQWTGNQTPTVDEVYEWCEKQAAVHKELSFFTMGPSDAGVPIKLMVLSSAKDSADVFDQARTGTTILVNNAIHPGEPDGVNAMILWIEKWINDGKKMKGMPTIAFIPIYNVGGALRRNSHSRANQDGPEEYGFRGNTRNLDLNRDFIKMDTKNAFTFAKIYQALDPDVFIDNHVSNGADYQHTLTLITSLKDRYPLPLRQLIYDKLLPDITADLEDTFPLVPYVHTMKGTPDSGIQMFNDIGRYASGYGSLFNSISFTVETHMLKPFPQRVQATQAFFEVLLAYVVANKVLIEKVRAESQLLDANSKSFLYNYQLDTNKYDSVYFRGYTAKYKPSEVTGLDRLYYDRNEPWENFIPYFNHYVPADSVEVPVMYVVKKSEEEIIRRLRANGVALEELTEKSVIPVVGQRVVYSKAGNRPYENHFLHREVEVEFSPMVMEFLPGDVLVRTNQSRARFIHSALLAEAEDSYFRWNFMDGFLDRKEYFSPYVFEDKAAQLLKEHPEWKLELEEAKKANPELANSAWLQLDFIYQKSQHAEKTNGLLPIYLVFPE